MADVTILAETCACGLDGELRMCIKGIVFGPCDHPDCGGVCEPEGDCEHECHRRTES